MRTARIKSLTEPMVPRKHASHYSAKLVSSSRTSKKVELKIRLRSETLKTLASQKGPMKALIEIYGAAVEKSRLLGSQSASLDV